MLALASDQVCEICKAPKVKFISKGQPPMIICIDPKCEGARKERTLGKCPSCGGDIMVLQSKKGKRFAGCDKFPECKVMFPLPQFGRVVPTGEACDACKSPIVKVWQQKGRPPWVLCINMECPKREKKKEKKKAKQSSPKKTE
jgi:DNA topoisomerase-1